MSRQVGKPGDPVNEPFWQRSIVERIRSGLTIQAFRQIEWLIGWSFRWWRHEQARRDQEVTTTRSGWNKPGHDRWT